LKPGISYCYQSQHIYYLPNISRYFSLTFIPRIPTTTVKSAFTLWVNDVLETFQQRCSLETWSRPRDLSRGPVLGVTVSKVFGHVSVSKATGLGHKPTFLRL